MYFTQDRLNSLLADVTPEDRDHQVRTTLTDLAPRLAAKRNEYRNFGPFWWWVKPILRSMPATRRSWIRGGFVDRRVLDNEIQHAAPDWLPWLGLRYYEAEALDDTPANFHILERPDGEVEIYRLYDADASEQIDLFDAGDRENRELTQFLADPVRFSGSAWLQRADTYIAEGDLLRAGAALRRAVDRAVDETDRSTAWIRLGQLFQEHRHTRKAILCYKNAWEREREGWIQGLIAEAYLDNDQPQEAIAGYEAALAAMPGNPEYQAGLERCRRLTEDRASDFVFAVESLAR